MYKDNQILECKLETVSQQDDAQNNICHLDDAGYLTGNKHTDVVTMEMIYKEMNELKVKAKVYDTLLMGSTCLIIVLIVLIVAVIVVISRIV